MILQEDVFKIGQIQKPHGLQGELSFTFTSDIFNEIDFPCFICEIDGILVPFFIESYRFKNDEIGLVKFENIDSEEKARMLSKSSLYIEKKYLPQDVTGVDVEGSDYYIDFTIIDQNEQSIGRIVDIDDETENILFLVIDENGEEIIIPAVDDFILGIDDDHKIIQMDLPEGLLDLSQAEDAGE